ncbi:MAG: hypothetical protein CMJ46_11545 [Planctomyces sp.]|nr:hypothetical protein [Planctomyces sp.]
MYSFIEIDCGSEHQEPFSVPLNILLLCNQEFNIPENRDLQLALGGSGVFSQEMMEGLRCTETWHFGRGLPVNVSRQIIYKYAMYVVDPRIAEVYRRLRFGYLRKTKAVSNEEADKLVADGKAFPLKYTEVLHDPNRGEKLIVRFVSYPGHVAANWLYLSEIYENLKYCGISLDELRDHKKQMFPSLLEFMKLLEVRYGKNRVRMVMYFLYCG